ncbi:MAG: FecR domain-containing protein [Prolixibacteraceae bacterium]
MSMEEEQIYTLIAKNLQGDITDKESVILESWKSESERNKNEFNDLAELWKQSGRLQFPVRIDAVKALSEVHVRGGIIKRKVPQLSWFGQVAAILLLSVLFSGLYTYFFSEGSSHEYYEEVVAAHGTRTSIDLPDGSVVFLNSGSSLRFSSQLGQNKERKVKLKGEGYFKVAKDPGSPFIVDAGKLFVEALGTAFNVNACHPDSQIEVALIEGKVAVHSGSGKKSANDLILSPNELARFNITTNSLLKESLDNPEKYIGWTEGKMIFADDPIRDVIQRLENWYHVEIRVQDQQLLNYRFTGTFVDEPLEEILNAFSLTSPLHYAIKPGIKNDQGEYSKRIIILKHR